MWVIRECLRSRYFSAETTEPMQSFYMDAPPPLVSKLCGEHNVLNESVHRECTRPVSTQLTWLGRSVKTSIAMVAFCDCVISFVTRGWSHKLRRHEEERTVHCAVRDRMSISYLGPVPNAQCPCSGVDRSRSRTGTNHMPRCAALSVETRDLESRGSAH